MALRKTTKKETTKAAPKAEPKAVVNKDTEALDWLLVKLTDLGGRPAMYAAEAQKKR